MFYPHSPEHKLVGYLNELYTGKWPFPRHGAPWRIDRGSIVGRDCSDRKLKVLNIEYTQIGDTITLTDWEQAYQHLWSVNHINSPAYQQFVILPPLRSQQLMEYLPPDLSNLVESYLHLNI